MRLRTQPSHAQPRISITLQVSPALNTELDETARSKGLTRHAFILTLIRQGLERLTAGDTASRQQG